MFGIGFFELCIIAIVALVFFGPQKLPELMQQFGKFFVQIRRMSNDVKASFDQIVEDAEEELRKEQQKKLESAIAKRMSKQADDHPAEPLEAETQAHGHGPEAVLHTPPYQDPQHPSSGFEQLEASPPPEGSPPPGITPPQPPKP